MRAMRVVRVMHGGRSMGAVALACALAACSSDDDPPHHPGTGGGGAGASGSSAVSSSVGISTGSAGGGGTLPETFTVSGVVTDGQRPLAGAMVMQGGALEPAMITGADGAFSVELTKTIPGQPTVVAALLGYRADGEEFFEVPDGPVELALRQVSAPDNPSYVYGEPGVGDPVLDDNTALCGHCHTTLVAQFQGSAHARSAKGPMLQDLYAGVSRAHDDAASCAAAGGEWRAGIEPGAPGSAADKCYLGGGVLPDLNPGCGAPGGLACDDPALPAAQAPVAFGTCADCHAPAIEGKAGGRDLHEASGNAFDNGNHCDFCHHVREVQLDAAPGNAGRLVVQRPNDTTNGQPGGKLLQVMFGPIPDVPNGFMGGSVQPQFSTAVLCAGCHQQEQAALVPGSSLDPARWPDGLPVHSSYQEWKESPFAPTTPCQACHMPPDESGLSSSVDVLVPEDASIANGFVRPPSRTRQHVFLGPLAGSPRLIDSAVQLFVSPVAGPSGIEVAVTLYNGLAGHAVPTGEPMRALLLLVRAEACGEPLAATGGMTIHDVGGALAEGEVGAGVTAAGAALTWAEGAARAKPGDVVRAVRPTGAFDDYPGIGFFADLALGPEDKGMPRREPVGEATVVSVAGGVVTLDAALALVDGDRLLLGTALLGAPVDGEESRALAGAAGQSFARVLVDAGGERLVPHYRAVDMASDNRLAPQIEQVTAHTFALPPGCDAALVSATLVYRPVPLHLAALRGWEARDWVIAEASESVALP